MDKVTERRRAIGLRDRLTVDQRKTWSQEILQRLTAMVPYRRAHTVMSYVPIGSEVDVRPLIFDLSQQSGKTLVLPVTLQHEKRLIPKAVRSVDDLVPGPYGILQPAEPISPFPLHKIDVVIVPAIVYDMKGFRLGYGGGYYDRFLPTLSAATQTIGVQYDCLVVDKLPTDHLDVPVNMIVTERRVIDIG